MDRSLTMHLGLAVRVRDLVGPVLVVLVALAGRVRVVPAVLVRVGPVLVVLVVLVRVGPVLVVLVGRVLVALAGRVVRVRVRRVRVGLGDRVVRVRVVRVIRVALGVQVALGVLVDRVIRVIRVALGVRVDRVILVIRVALGVRVDRVILVALAGRVIRVVRDLVGPGVLVARVVLVRVDRVIRVALAVRDLVGPRLLTCNTVTTTGVARSGVARGMHPTASARRVTVRRLRLPRTDSGGTVDHPPERRRPTGTGHRLLAAGTDRRLLAAGTRNGMGRRVTSAGRRLITGRSTTTATTPLQCSIRCSVDGDSGSSATGFRCTDLTSTGLPSSSKAGGQLRIGWALETDVQVYRAA